MSATNPTAPVGDGLEARLDVSKTEPLRAATAVVFLCLAVLGPSLAFGLLASGRFVGFVIGTFWAPIGLCLGAFAFAGSRSAQPRPGVRWMAVATLAVGVVHIVLCCAAGVLLLWELSNTSAW